MLYKNTGASSQVWVVVVLTKPFIQLGNGNISYNTVDSTGFNAVEFDGDATVIQNNFVNNFGFILDDGGGNIYIPKPGNKELYPKNIKHNIVLNGIGAGAGTHAPTSNQALGIYLDGNHQTLI